jgi:hypothetical protein
MTTIANVASNPSKAVRLLRDNELDAVNGGITGNDQGCIPPFITVENGTLVFHSYSTSPNPWLRKPTS